MQLFANNAYSVLSAGIDGVTTVIEVASGASFPSPTGGDHFLATLIGLDVNLNETSWEIVKVTTRTANVLTVVRGQDGTAAQAWPSATRVELRVSAENLTTLRAEGSAAAPVQSVAGQIGVVTLVKGDVGLGNVDNTSDAAKPVSTATQTALNEKQATLVSGTNIKTVNSTTLMGSGNLTVGDATLVGTETLTNKTLTAPVLTTPTINSGYTEQVFAVTGTMPALSPANGSIQTWALTGNSAPTVGSWANGQSMTLMIDDGTAMTINWGVLGVNWIGGSAPTLDPLYYTIIELWKVGGIIYGALVGVSS